MWLYFDQNGALLKNLEHGSPARAGTDDFEIFAVFEGMENSLTYPEAIISFKKPDSAGSVYYEFPMEPQKTFKFVRDSHLTGEETDASVLPFRNDVYYTGFYFSFHEFLGRMRNNILLDTAGTWQATIGLVSSDDEDNVVGMATFYVQPGVIDEEGQFVELDEYIQDFLALLITKMNRKGSDVIRFVRDLSSIEEFDDNNYKIGDIIFDKETKNFYEITTLNPAHANLEGYQPLIDAGHMLSADLVSDTTTEHKFVTETQRNDIDLNTAARHTHSNKAVLDTLEDTQAVLNQKINAKVDKTTYPLKIYGTDEFGTQVVFDKSDFYGLVQDVRVDGVSVMNGVVAEINLTGKADKVSGAIADNLAGLDASGNLKDSGIAKNRITDLENNLSAFDQRLDDIEEIIPEQAYETGNELADKEFVNSSIATNTATFRGTYNIITDLGLTTSATEEQIATAIASKLASLSITPTKNDYVFVAYPDEDTIDINIVEVFGNMNTLSIIPVLLLLNGPQLTLELLLV